MTKKQREKIHRAIIMWDLAMAAAWSLIAFAGIVWAIVSSMDSDYGQLLFSGFVVVISLEKAGDWLRRAIPHLAGVVSEILGHKVSNSDLKEVIGRP